MHYRTSSLKGVIDMHVHASPDVYPRKWNELELVRKAKSAGMKGVLLKSHHTLTADRGWLLRKMVRKINIFGGLVLNLPSCGGLNPKAVETAIKFGAKEIWMPTISANHHISNKKEGDTKQGITISTGNGKVPTNLMDILELIATNDIILGTGHLSPQESKVLVKLAKDHGVEKILVTHPEWELVSMPIKLQRDLVRKNAMIEHCYYATTGKGGSLNIQKIANQIKYVGAENCIISTDLGQANNPSPIRGMKDYIKALMKYGISEREINIMTKKNPSKLLELPV